MRSWILILGGMIAWTTHFFALYAIGETVGGSPGGRMAVLGVTLLCLAGDLLVARAVLRLPQHTRFDEWRRFAALAGAGLSALAIVWQLLPALL